MTGRKDLPGKRSYSCGNLPGERGDARLVSSMLKSRSPVPAWAALLLLLAASLGWASETRSEGSPSESPSEGTASEWTLDRPMIGLPVNLPHVDDVKDPIFAILIGLVENDIYGTLTQQRLMIQLERMRKTSKLPYQSVIEVTRLPSGNGRPTNEISVTFDGELSLPIPYSILGYNPGSFRASRQCLFREWRLGTVTLNHSKKKGDGIEVVPVVLEDVYLFGLESGRVTLDIDGWLDRMLGGSLDDTDIVGLMLCRYQGKWMGVAMGYNEDRRGRSGALDFREDKVVFPSPDEMKTVGRTMRSRVEGLLAQARSD